MTAEGEVEAETITGTVLATATETKTGIDDATDIVVNVAVIATGMKKKVETEIRSDVGKEMTRKWTCVIQRTAL